MDVTHDSLAERQELLEFGLNYDKDEILKTAKGFLRITHGDFEYRFFNVCALHDILSQVLEALYNGFIPYIDLYDRQQGWFNWNKYFKQPYENRIDIDSLMKSSIPIELGQKLAVIWVPFYPSIFDEIERRVITKLYRDWVILNDDTKGYVDKECADILGNNNVIGVLGRGTDMVSNLPLYHPYQPSIEELIKRTDKAITKYNYNKIYLATEEEIILEKFQNAFPGMILENKRKYVGNAYKKKYEQDKTAWIGQVIYDYEENTSDLEYLSSIYILSKCDSLVAGNCGGSEAAVYLNEGKFKHCEVIDLGYNN